MKYRARGMLGKMFGSSKEGVRILSVSTLGAM